MIVRMLRFANGRAAEILVIVGAGAILGCDLLDPTLDARIYAASEHALGSAAWLFHTGLAALFVVVVLLYVRLQHSPSHRRVRQALLIGAIGVIGVVVFPTDPGWTVVSVPGRLHPIFALIAAGSLLYVGSRLTRPRRLLFHIALFYGAGFVGGFVGGGAGFAERFALAVVGLLLYLGAYRSRVAGSAGDAR
jgi:TctA family transporter